MNTDLLWCPDEGSPRALLYRRAARTAGKTKYPFGKMLRLAIDGIVSFSLAPLRLATWLGFLASGLALAGIVYVLVLRLLTAVWVSGWASLLVAVLFLGGVQLLCLGILGAYLGCIYGEVKRRSLYLVKERLGFPPAGRGRCGMSLRMSSDTARWLKLLIGLAASAGFVWLLAREVDLDALGGVFAGLPVSTVLLALAFLATGWAVRIVRWWWMLRALEPTLPLGACAGPFLAGMAVNNVAPFRAGDALRVLGFRRQLRAPAMAVAGTLVVERVLDVAVLTGILFLGLLGLPDGAFPRSFVVAAASLAGSGLAAILVLPLLVPVLGRIGERLPATTRRWTNCLDPLGRTWRNRPCTS